MTMETRQFFSIKLLVFNHIFRHQSSFYIMSFGAFSYNPQYWKDGSKEAQCSVFLKHSSSKGKI